MKRRNKWLCFLILGALAAACPVLWALSEPPPEKSDAAKILAVALPRAHISRQPCDDTIATNALNEFLDSLDYDHTIFLASDIAGFQAETTNLDNRLRAGDVSFAYKVYDILLERLSNRVNYVDLLLTNGFDMTQKEMYQWKRKDMPWPADETEWNEIWRKKIKNQYATKLVADILAKEEKAANTNIETKTAATNEASDIEEAQLTPEESVRKGFKQYLTVLNDYEPSWVLERYLTAFTRSYDPHSDYLSASESENFDISMKLSLVGIGALLGSEDGAAKIERLIPGGPAERDGRLKTGDKIIAVAQGDEEPVNILHWPLTKAVRLIRGAKNTKVVLTVIPASDPTGGITKKIDLIREEVKLEEQAAKGESKDILGSDGVSRTFGVIRLPEFYADIKARRENGPEPRSSSKDVAKLLADLQTNHISGLVLDLRNNGGGLLAEAIEMTGLFISSGPVVQVSDGRETEVLSDDDPETAYTGPMVVLVNRETASASEILAGALQDYGRAIIVGDTKTHGKGTVQSMTNLRGSDPSLGTLKVTTASFYRIAGGSTQRKGVVPDIITPSILDSMEVGEEYLPHALMWSTVFPALYRRTADLGSILPVLKQQSEERCEKNPQFMAYRNLVEQLGERQKASEISLNLQDRLQFARSEKELQKLLQDTDGSDEEKGQAKKNQDVILNEALNILSDFTILQKKPTDVITAGL